MTLSVIHSRAQLGVSAPPVSVEVHLSAGLPSLSVVGLPEAAVKESKDRVRSALLNANFEFPRRRITVNLAPADLPKEGGRFDLPIALGILAASRQLNIAEADDYEFLGELSLGAQVRPVRGVLPAVLAAAQTGRKIVVPAQNLPQAALARQAHILGADHLLAVTAHFNGGERLTRAQMLADPCVRGGALDLADVRGQVFAKRALEVAAAGGHSLLLVGPPGTGKTMLASRLPGILPRLDDQEALETASVQSLASDEFDPAVWKIRPFRSPHHSASGVALVGGGSQPRPGEISLAHNGVLFLDELTEFPRRVLDLLREPLEAGVVNISRAARRVRFPARFQLVAAMNPCPCGYLGEPDGRCHCTREQIERYRARLSGPLIDRIDLHVEVPPVPRSTLRAAGRQGDDSATVRSRVQAARRLQLKRQGCLNHQLQGKDLNSCCRLEPPAQTLLDQAMVRLGLSARAYHRVLRMARSIADLENSDVIIKKHVAEAVGYRVLDRRSSHSG